MPSASLQTWRSARQAALDELEAAHRSIGGTGPGRRYATHQINQAYAVLLSSQFQGFCRDLHSECADFFAANVQPGLPRRMFESVLVLNRKLDKGNPNPGNIGDDYNRFKLAFWHEVNSLDRRNKGRRSHLDELNKWRNAIAHQDFDPAVLGSVTLQIEKVRTWRSACNQLAGCFDEVMCVHIEAVNGISPW